MISLDPNVSDETIIEGPNLRICIGPYRRRRARDFFAAERAYLLKVLRRERPDLVHAHWTYEWALAAQASGIPHVITAHDAPLAILRYDRSRYRIARTLMAYKVLSRAKRVVSVSPYVAAHLQRFMLYSGRPEIVPNGMPESVFRRASAWARQEGQDLTFATSLNGWAGRKNGQVAIRAFAHVRKRYPRSRLIMFGSGHGMGQDGHRWADARNLASGIEFAGRVPRRIMLNRLASEVDVLVHPALEEAQGMVLIEAMALGLPVIAGGSSGGTRWTLDEGRAGLLTDVTDPFDVATALNNLAASPEARQQWGRRGRLLAVRRFHIRAVADAYERIYDGMVSDE
jgi:glycosyltransferase involved in cell wall biosynthesis